MLNHINTSPTAPNRVVILGAQGFVGRAISNQFTANQLSVVDVTRADIDFCSASASSYLKRLFQPNDVVVIAAAKAPVKNNNMLLDNIVMMQQICQALEVHADLAQVVYISSDAVYQDAMEPMNEDSFAAPTSLHGVMHLAREQMLASVVAADKLLCVRPTLIYGPGDPHNGYGPNQFYRLAEQGQPIKLFGDGEELRDHIFIGDVARLATLAIMKRSYGVINAVTGQVVSFADIADAVKKLLGRKVEIIHLPRSGPMPHNGYRAFDVSAQQAFFPEFTPTTLTEGLRYFIQAEEAVYV